MVSHRLSKRDWLDHALRTLSEEGHGSLRAERLAASLGVSRGSFYWHFADVREFEAALLAHWEAAAMDHRYDHAIATAGPDRARALEVLLRSVFEAPVNLERAVRSWATDSSNVAAAVLRVDGRRVELLQRILPSDGSSTEQTRVTAVTLYWAYLGHVVTGAMIPPSVASAELFARFGLPRGSNEGS